MNHGIFEGKVLGVVVPDVGNPAAFELLRESLEAFPVNDHLPEEFRLPWGTDAETEIQHLVTNAPYPEIKIRFKTNDRRLSISLGFTRIKDVYIRVLTVDFVVWKSTIRVMANFVSMGTSNLEKESGFFDSQGRYYFLEKHFKMFD
jgi:hypothetical protein